jgi:hypothetical protein
MAKKNKINTKNILLFLIALCSFVFFAGVGESAMGVTLVNPVQDTTITGTSNFTNTITEPNDITNVSIWYQISGTGAWYLMSSQLNTTANQTGFATNYVTTGLSDRADYTFNITVCNTCESGAEIGNCASDTNTGVDVDNTNPTAKMTFSRLSARYYDPLGIEYDCSTSTDNVDTSLTYSVVLTKGDATTVTKTTSTGSFTESNLDSLGAENYIICTVTDNAGKTDSTTKEYITVIKEDGTKVVSEKQQEKKNNTLYYAIGGVIGFGLILYAVYYITQDSKKKRKK